MALSPHTALSDSSDYPPLRALNDLLFCPRRCFLHRVEGLWVENVHTTTGTLDHRRVHAQKDTEEFSCRIARGLWLVSHRLRLVGVADLIEFHPDPAGRPDAPFPVEYKRGRKRRWDNDDVQLCARALCLEEMLTVKVPAGSIYHVRSRRRREVTFDGRLRQQTEDAVARLHVLLSQQGPPPPVLHPKCKQCSVHGLCLPELIAQPAAYRRAAGSLFALPVV